jgi:hypothetical protein
MTKAANLANLASNTNFGILNIVRGGTGIGTFNTSGILVYEGGNALSLSIANTNYGGTGLTSFTPDGAMYALDANTLTTGTLPVVSGGTGSVSLANNALVVGQGFDPVYTISPSTANNVLMSNGTRWVSNTLTQLVSGLDVLGGAQAWSDVAGSRSVNTSYNNSTGKPIMVSVVAYSSAAGTKLAANVDAVTIANTSIAAQTQTVQMIVPNGSTYMIYTTSSGTTTVNSWAELR